MGASRRWARTSRPLAGPATERLDVRGKALVPGFLDSHTHLDIVVTLPALLREAIPRGLTALVTEMVQVTSALGTPGARWFLDTLRVQPIHAYATAPVISYLTAEAGRGEPLLDGEALGALLEDPRVLGLGEVYWHRLVPEPERLLPLIDRARALGKTVEGHAAGARGPRLMACAAAGMDSCHEPITAGEALERLRLGMRVMIREGSVRRDLEAVLKVRHAGVSLRRATLASDGIWPPDLLAHGYMDGIVQRAIDLGLPPVTAYQMASLNAAEHFGFDREIGGSRRDAGRTSSSCRTSAQCARRWWWRRDASSPVRGSAWCRVPTYRCPRGCTGDRYRSRSTRPRSAWPLRARVPAFA
jgi:adenine deaminase